MQIFSPFVQNFGSHSNPLQLPQKWTDYLETQEHHLADRVVKLIIVQITVQATGSDQIAIVHLSKFLSSVRLPESSCVTLNHPLIKFNRFWCAFTAVRTFTPFCFLDSSLPD